MFSGFEVVRRNSEPVENLGVHRLGAAKNAFTDRLVRIRCWGFRLCHVVLPFVQLAVVAVAGRDNSLPIVVRSVRRNLPSATGNTAGSSARSASRE